MKYCAILLAAGQASRMGAVKALLPLPLLPGGASCSALEGLVRCYRGVGVDDILVVSGFHVEDVEAAARDLGLAVARNPRPEQGMFSSVCAGLRAVPEDCASCFVHPVDVPLVRPMTLSALLDAAAGKLPAVVLRGGAYLRHGMMGADVLANLVSAAHAKELYVILDMNTAEPECWAGYGADAVTVCPYGGSGCLEAGEMLPIAAVRTGGQVQSLVAGDRALWLSVAEQMARRGAALAVSTGYSLDVRDVRRVCPGAFLLLEDCDGENALPAFDDMGHGALAADSALQYAAEPAAAVEEAVRAWKQWVTVV